MSFSDPDIFGVAVTQGEGVGGQRGAILAFVADSICVYAGRLG